MKGRKIFASNDDMCLKICWKYLMILILRNINESKELLMMALWCCEVGRARGNNSKMEMWKVPCWKSREVKDVIMRGNEWGYEFLGMEVVFLNEEVKEFFQDIIGYDLNLKKLTPMLLDLLFQIVPPKTNQFRSNVSKFEPFYLCVPWKRHNSSIVSSYFKKNQLHKKRDCFSANKRKLLEFSIKKDDINFHRGCYYSKRIMHATHLPSEKFRFGKKKSAIQPWCDGMKFFCWQ